LLPSFSGEFPGDVVANAGEVANISDAGEIALRGNIANAVYSGPGIVLGLNGAQLGWRIAADFSRVSPESKGLFFSPTAENATYRYAMALRQDSTGGVGVYYLVPNTVTTLNIGAKTSWGFGSGYRVNEVNATAVDSTNGYLGYGRTIKEGEWTTYTPAWTASTTNPVIGNGTLAGWVMRTGKTVFFEILMVPGTSTTFGSGTYSFSLPYTAHSDYGGSGRYPKTFMSTLIDNSESPPGNHFTASAQFGTTSTIFLNTIQGTGGPHGAVVTPSFPFTFALSDRIMIEGWYEGA
jgi:hypothetical protein